IAQFGSLEQRRRFLPGLLAGKTLLTAALERTVTDGVVDFVPWAQRAARVLVPTSEGLFLVDPRQAKLLPQLPTTGEPQSRMTFAGGELLGDEIAVDWIRDRALALQCATAIGITERALRMTAEYTSTRRQFDRPIATFQAVSQRAADAYIDVETIR